MEPRVLEQVTAALAQFTSVTRLYALTLGDGATPLANGELLVEAFVAHDAVDGIGTRDVIVLCTHADVDIEALLGRPAAFETRLADGTLTRFFGDVSEAAMLGCDGGFARYRIRISPWMWRLGQVRNSRVWQEKTVIDIVDAVFRPYQPLAKWRWSDDAIAFMAHALPRSYCCQYRESDLDFVRRILSEEGLCWRFEDADDGQVTVLFGDSSRPHALPEDASSAAGGGLRFHGARAVESTDTIQALTAQRRLHATLATVASYDYKGKQVVAASSPSRFPSGRKLPIIETYDVPGQYACANGAQARRCADLHMEAAEARSALWTGRSTVRTLRAGTRMTVTGSPVRQLGDAPAFTILGVTSVGVNNLPPPAQHALAALFGPIPELLQECLREKQDEQLQIAIAQATASGYANCFSSIRADLPWRPQMDGDGGRGHAKPTAYGAQSAIVVGPGSDDVPGGADELHCDRLGRVRIRFHWQDSGDATCWVRVAQRHAGGGAGSQFLPRIGQEVLVQFLENDIDRPIVVGALYNGQGEGGIAPTPGGQVDTDSDTSCFAPAHDHARSGQGNLAGGNSPVWHGASGDSAGHRNAGAQWGVRSKEFGGSGYNQLLFDDTDAQGRVQLKSTHAASELTLGHLIHAADNYRGSFRGLGAELRTDAHGAVRAGRGLLVSSYPIEHGAAARDPAGDNRAGIAMLQQAASLAQTFHCAALVHQTVGLAARAGATKASASRLDDKAAPLAAMLASMSGRVDEHSLDAAMADAAARNTAADKGTLPHTGDAIIAIAAKDGLAANAAQSVQLANGETVTLASGADTQFVTGGQMRVHTMQAIGVLGGAAAAGSIGLQLIAAKDAIDIQAQADALKVQARDEINVISAHAHIDWVAAKRISLSTAGGANITIEGGNIEVQCPGKILVQAGKKSFTGPDRLSVSMPGLPREICVECLKKSLAAGPAFTSVE